MTPFKITFTTYRGSSFDDYVFQLTGISVATKNTIAISEALDANDTKYSDGSFNLFGNGYGGYEITLRIPKQKNKLDENEIIKYMEDKIKGIYSSLK